MTGDLLFTIGLVVFFFFGFFACCEPLNKVAPCLALAGYALVLLGGFFP